MGIRITIRRNTSCNMGKSLYGWGSLATRSRNWPYPKGSWTIKSRDQPLIKGSFTHVWRINNIKAREPVHLNQQFTKGSSFIRPCNTRGPSSPKSVNQQDLRDHRWKEIKITLEDLQCLSLEISNSLRKIFEKLTILVLKRRVWWALSLFYSLELVQQRNFK